MSRPEPARETDEENEPFRDIEWLMPRVEVRDVLDGLGVRIDRERGDQTWGWCPDHRLFVGREPSHPKWTVNRKTGETFCFTEGRGSNLVFVASRLRKCTPKEAAEWMTGGMDMSVANIRRAQVKLKKLVRAEPEKKEPPSDIELAQRWIETGRMYRSGYEFFMHPPGKKATLITRETVDLYRCVQIRSGFYADRVIVPHFHRGTLAGFTAIDVLGKDTWLKRHPTLGERDYKKTRFPKNFRSAEHLFGFDDLQSGCAVVLTEGAREVMKLRQLGYFGVAIDGARLHSAQIRLLAEANPSRVGLMFDGDSAGYEAQRKAYESLKEFFPTVKLNTPWGYDPKSLPEEDLRKVMEKAEINCNRR